MKTFIALLRGINVSGHKIVKMADLRILLETSGLQNVRTYIQSGNIVFESDLNADELENLIKEQIADKYGFDVPTLVLTHKYVAEALENNPFATARNEDPKRLYITFLNTKPDPDRVTNLSAVDYAPEEYIVAGKVIYFYSPKEYGKAKMSNNFFEAKLKVSATSRNWNTCNKLLEMSK